MSADPLHIPVPSILTSSNALGQPMAIRNSYYIIHLATKEDQNRPDYRLENTYFVQQTLEEVAIQIVEQNSQPDAVLVPADIEFNKLVGFRKLLQENAIPFILYSTHFDKEQKERAILLNADDYLFGTITPVFLSRIDFFKKLIRFKNNSLHVAKHSEMPLPSMWSLKRPFDIFVSLVALFFLSPILSIVALIIKLESRGPVFYISKRAGSGYKIFNFYKFRSMRVGADQELTGLAGKNQYGQSKNDTIFFKIKDDPRVTPFGLFLRKTSLDELPQLFNILKGDMSLVGNRPLPLYEANRLTKDQVVWRFLAPAGITGLWQITKRGRESMLPEERIQLDTEYAMKNSFWLDLKIIFRTFPALLQKEKV